MKILLWSQHFWPENFLINDLAAMLARHGHEVTVLTGKPNYPGGVVYPGYSRAGVQREWHAGIQIVRIPLMPRGRGTAFRLALNYLSFIASGYLLAPWSLRGRRFDAVFVYATSPVLQALPAIFLSWLKRAPLTVWVQDLWPESLRATGFVRSSLLLSAVKTVVRHIYRSCDLILVQSEAFRASVQDLAGPQKTVNYFPNAILAPPLAASRAEVSDSLAESMQGFFTVVFAGNIGKAQSCETILRAAALLGAVEEIRFYIVGTGSHAATIAEEVAGEKLANVILTGVLAPEAMPQLFAAASVLLVTLVDDPAMSATIPSKLQAYLAAGKPVIASLNGEGARVVLAAQAGLTSPAEDAGALADRILALYRMTVDERLRLGNNGARYFKAHFDLEARVRELTRHFEDLQKKCWR
ncbi:MAG: glycosyltransferase family 4 protein [Polaromonas sp.]